MWQIVVYRSSVGADAHIGPFKKRWYIKGRRVAGPYNGCLFIVT